MARKLASIRKILKLEPIENADNLELAKIGGWQCVVKKGEFSVGDLCVYFEIDSLLPIDPRFEFLRKSSYKVLPSGISGFRLRTIKLRGPLSQGLIMPLSEFPELPQGQYDVTDALKVMLYEPPVSVGMRGQAKGLFPVFIRKTDAERIQNLTEYFLSMVNEPFEVTEKLDGSSMTIYCINNGIGVCSRNMDLKEEENNTFWKSAKDIIPSLKKLGKNIALQGELVGEGIQKNRLKIRGQKFFLFSIYNIDQHSYVSPDERKNIFETLKKNCPIEHVPILIEKDYTFQRYTNIDKLLEFAEGFSCINSASNREGVVFKSYNNPNIIFKAISNKYLLQEK
jgi:RNA ligase (TIGR02306 family)